MEKTQAQATVTVELTHDDIRDLVAFGNRAQMSGVEAPRWCELNAKLVSHLRPQPAKDPGLELVGPNESAGGTD